MIRSWGTLFYSTSLLTTASVAYSPVLAFSIVHPVHVTVTALALCTLLLSLSAKYVISPTQPQKGRYEAIPLDEISSVLSNVTRSPQSTSSTPLASSSKALVLFIATLALAARIEILRRLQLDSECTSRSIQILIPLLIALYDAVRFQRSQLIEYEDEIDASAYEALSKYLKASFLSSRWRYVPLAALLSWGAYFLTGLWDSSQSTYICPVTTGGVSQVFRLQVLALVLDTVLAVAVYESSIVNGDSVLAISTVLRSWSVVTGVTALLWAFIGVMIYRLQPENRTWLFLQEGPAHGMSVFSLVGRALVLALVLVSALGSVLFFGALHVTMLLTVVSTIVPGFRFLWSSRRPFPPASATALTWSFVLIYLSWSCYRRLQRSIDPADEAPSFLRRFLIFTTFMIMIAPGLFKSDTVHFHPIDLLMYDAQKLHLTYLNEAARSNTLKEAVQSYQDRYGDNPPPGFDAWFDFANKKSVWITDEFDQIFDDLLPFRTISPADIRQQTWDMVSNPWNEISGITIRNGRAEVQENVLPTHRWMLEGVAVLINSFAHFLPDMDLAFNLNDEARVAMKYDDARRTTRTAESITFKGKSTWSTDRSSGWLPIPQEPTSDTILENWSFSNTFHEWGTAACSPSSPARQNHLIYPGQQCHKCALPHSFGQFPANWTLSSDPCHQPDLSHLHGFYLSPAAFKATHSLRPIFSQSKAAGYNDVLYPSAWNYMNKVKYDPTNATDSSPGFPDPLYREKSPTLFWRGATSEGVSSGVGQWRGMLRQRLVHMANNVTSSSTHDRINLLLPDTRNPRKYTYTNLPATALRSLGLKPDMLFVDHIARCGNLDCPLQESEFCPESVPSTEFQAHWQHKFLFDADGAGFSGRFLPFLESRSLPFKSALFRNWYDSRLFPWLHFVPVDLRLHGLWSTLAYFAGVEGESDGWKGRWPAHEREGELIAEAGREWAGRVLRKEDMEVYFFRLLLEWARLTDDRREQLGFVA